MSALSKASLEALLLLQVFVAGANSLGITSFAVPYPFVVSPTKLISLFVNPILYLIVLFAALVQVRVKSSATKKQNLTLEFLKSGIVTVLWVWLLVNVVVGSGPLGWQVNGILAVVVNALVYIVVFYSTLWIAWTRTSGGRIHLGGQSASLLPQ